MCITRNKDNATVCKSKRRDGGMGKRRKDRVGIKIRATAAATTATAAAAAASRLTSKFTFVDVGLDDLYVLVGAPVAHLLLLLVKLNIHTHNSTSP